MNRSQSKIRHIQQANLILEQRRVLVKEDDSKYTPSGLLAAAKAGKIYPENVNAQHPFAGKNAVMWTNVLSSTTGLGVNWSVRLLVNNELLTIRVKSDDTKKIAKIETFFRSATNAPTYLSDDKKQIDTTGMIPKEGDTTSIGNIFYNMVYYALQTLS